MPETATEGFNPSAPTVLNLRLLLLTAVVAYGIYRYVVRRITYQEESEYGASRGCKPMNAKIPYKWPLALDLLKQQYDANQKKLLLSSQTPFFDELGPNVEYTLFGGSGFLTFDPENLEAVFSSCFEDYGLGSRTDGFWMFLGAGIFTQDGSGWKHSRELLRRPFARMGYQDLKCFTDPVTNLISRLSVLGGQGEIVDLQPLFFRLTLATTTGVIFGQPVETFEGENQDTFASSFDYASNVSAIRLRLSELYWAYTPRRYRTACSNVKRYALEFVDQALVHRKEAKSSAEGKYAFIEDLYSELKDPMLVRDQLVHVLLAGRDTTACLLSWTFFLLLRHPAALRRLQKEITDVMQGDETPTRTHVQKLQYLRSVLSETNRLYPPVPVNVRFATKTTVIPKGGGPDGQSPVLLRKGTGIGSSVYHMHRRKDLYGDDADDFRPERWEGDKLANIGWGFLPFLGGPRLCLGKDFALMEASYTVIRILQTFPNIRLPPNHPTVPTGQERQNLTIVVSSADGCKAVLK